MRVFVTGGTGFVGREILKQLTETGHTAICLVRPGSEQKVAILKGVEIQRGDATKPETLEGALRGCDAVIHLVGIIREFPSKAITFRRLHFEATRIMVEAAKAQGVKRYLQMSANGTRENAHIPYYQTKWQAEEAVRNSGLAWTIFRPSIIFGPKGEFINLLADMIHKYPVVPVIGNGRSRISLVAVEEVAKSFVLALDKEDAIEQIYHCCGPDELTFNDILDLLGQALKKKRVRKIHYPAWLMRHIVSLMESIPAFPITATQMTMLLEGNVCDGKPWAQAFGIKPQSFSEGIAKYSKI